MKPKPDDDTPSYEWVFLIQMILADEDFALHLLSIEPMGLIKPSIL